MEPSHSAATLLALGTARALACHGAAASHASLPPARQPGPPRPLLTSCPPTPPISSVCFCAADVSPHLRNLSSGLPRCIPAMTLAVALPPRQTLPGDMMRMSCAACSVHPSFGIVRVAVFVVCSAQTLPVCTHCRLVAWHRGRADPIVAPTLLGATMIQPAGTLCRANAIPIGSPAPRPSILVKSLRPPPSPAPAPGPAQKPQGLGLWSSPVLSCLKRCFRLGRLPLPFPPCVFLVRVRFPPIALPPPSLLRPDPNQVLFTRDVSHRRVALPNTCPPLTVVWAVGFRSKTFLTFPAVLAA
eukprot:EG_transcript_10349